MSIGIGPDEVTHIKEDASTSTTGLIESKIAETQVDFENLKLIEMKTKLTTEIKSL